MTDQKGKEGRLFIVPVDKSAHSERAFEWYVKHLHRPGDKVGIVHVHEPPHIAEAFGVWDRMIVEGEEKWQHDYKKSIEETKKVIKKFEDKANDLGVEHETFVKSSNHGPGHSICEVADNQKASGIIMGSRGLNFFRRTLLGSVSSYVVNHANTAVTVTPPLPSEKGHAALDNEEALFT